MEVKRKMTYHELMKMNNEKTEKEEKVVKNVPPKSKMSEDNFEKVHEPKKQVKIENKPILKENRVKSDKKLEKKVISEPIGETTSIKGVDKRLLMRLRSLFPSSTNNQDALNAFLVVYMEESMTGLNEDVKDLVRKFKKSDENVSFKENVNMLNKKMNAMKVILDEISLSTLYTNYDRLGFRRDSVLKVSDVNFIDDDIIKMSNILKDQTKKINDEKLKAEGRPIR